MTKGGGAWCNCVSDSVQSGALANKQSLRTSQFNAIVLVVCKIL